MTTGRMRRFQAGQLVLNRFARRSRLSALNRCGASLRCQRRRFYDIEQVSASSACSIAVRHIASHHRIASSPTQHKRRLQNPRESRMERLASLVRHLNPPTQTIASSRGFVNVEGLALVRASACRRANTEVRLFHPRVLPLFPLSLTPSTLLSRGRCTAYRSFPDMLEVIFMLTNNLECTCGNNEYISSIWHCVNGNKTWGRRPTSDLIEK